MKDDLKKRIEYNAYLMAEAEGFPVGRECEFWTRAEAKVMGDLAEEARAARAIAAKAAEDKSAKAAEDKSAKAADAPDQAVVTDEKPKKAAPRKTAAPKAAKDPAAAKAATSKTAAPKAAKKAPAPKA